MSSEIKPTDFSKFNKEQSDSSMAPHKIDMLYDIDLEVTVELGRKTVPLEEVLKMSNGTVIELSKLAGEPVDIYVNRKKMAEGEVVVVDENFAVRITQLVDTKERIKSLG